MRERPSLALLLFLLSSVVAMSGSLLHAQLPDDSCAVRYDGIADQDYNQFPHAMLELADGSLFMGSAIGTSVPTILDPTSFAGVKITILNPDRTVADVKIYRRPAWNWMPGSPHSLIQTQDGNLVMAGMQMDSTFSTSDGLLLKFTPKGDTIWSRLVGTYMETRLYGLTELPDGDLMVVGAQRGAVGNYDVYIARCDPQGITRWQKSVGYPDFDVATGILQNPSGDGFLVIGNTSSGNTFGGVSRYLLYVDSLGNRVWDKKMGAIGGGGTEFLTSLKLGLDDSPIIAGAGIENPDSGVVAIPYIAKINWSGGVFWEGHVELIDSLYGRCNGYLNDVYPQEDGTYIAVGALAVWSSRWHGIIAKFSASGELMWVRKYSPSYYFENYLTRVLPRQDEPGFFCYGAGHPGDTPQYDLWYMWLDPQGKLDTCGHVGVVPPVWDGKMLAYPNPADEMLAVQFPLPIPSGGKIQLLSLQGSLVAEQSVPAGLAEVLIDTRSIPNGVYVSILILPDGRAMQTKVAINR